MEEYRAVYEATVSSSSHHPIGNSLTAGSTAIQVPRGPSQITFATNIQCQTLCKRSIDHVRQGPTGSFLFEENNPTPSKRTASDSVPSSIPLFSSPSPLDDSIPLPDGWGLYESSNNPGFFYYNLRGTQYSYWVNDTPRYKIWEYNALLRKDLLGNVTPGCNSFANHCPPTPKFSP